MHLPKLQKLRRLGRNAESQCDVFQAGGVGHGSASFGRWGRLEAAVSDLLRRKKKMDKEKKEKKKKNEKEKKERKKEEGIRRVERRGI